MDDRLRISDHFYQQYTGEHFSERPYRGLFVESGMTAALVHRRGRFEEAIATAFVSTVAVASASRSLRGGRAARGEALREAFATLFGDLRP